MWPKNSFPGYICNGNSSVLVSYLFYVSFIHSGVHMSIPVSLAVFNFLNSDYTGVFT